MFHLGCYDSTVRVEIKLIIKLTFVTSFWLFRLLNMKQFSFYILLCFVANVFQRRNGGIEHNYILLFACTLFISEFWCFCELF